MLRIINQNRWLDNKPTDEIMAIPIDVLNGIQNSETKFLKGKKIQTEFYLAGEIAVRQYYADVLDQDSHLVAISTKTEWLDHMGNAALFNTRTASLSISEAAAEIIARRKRQINYLQEAGIRMGIKEQITPLFDYYSAYTVGEKTINVLNNYIENGSLDFETAIKTETAPAIVALLGEVLVDGKTIRESILYQIETN